MGRNAQKRKQVQETRRVLKGFRMPGLDMKMVRLSVPGGVWRDFCKLVVEINASLKEETAKNPQAPEYAEIMPTQHIYTLMVHALMTAQQEKRKAAADKQLIKPVGGQLLTQLEQFEREHPGETPRIRLPGEEDARGQKSQAPKHPGSSLIT